MPFRHTLDWTHNHSWVGCLGSIPCPKDREAAALLIAPLLHVNTPEHVDGYLNPLLPASS